MYFNKYCSIKINQNTNSINRFLNGALDVSGQHHHHHHLGACQVQQEEPHPVHVGVAPDLAVDPGPGDHPAPLVLQPLGPVPAVDGGEQASAGVADVDLRVLAARRPDHGPALRVVLDVQRELAVVVVDLAHAGALVEVYGEQVPVVSLGREGGREGGGSVCTKIYLDVLCTCIFMIIYI